MSNQFLNSLMAGPPFPLWVELLKVLVPVAAALFVGGATVWIARRQLNIAAGQLKLSEGQFELAKGQKEVAEAKLKLDLFDKRYPIFLETWTRLSEVVREGTMKKNHGLSTPFNNLVPQASFIFGPDIEQYLNDIIEHWARLWAIEGTTAANGNVVRFEDIQPRADLEKWFVDEANGGAKKRFGAYMTFENWH